MGERFEDLARTLSATQSRRQALKMLGGAALAAIGAAALKPFRAQGVEPEQGPCLGASCGGACCPAGLSCINAAQGICGCPAGLTQCGPTTCCRSGVICVNASKGKCGCPPASTPCGKGCCDQAHTCTQAATSCCCPPGKTPCGPVCCAGGVACINYNKGICGCPSGYARCVKNGIATCCPSNRPCGDESCVTPESLNNVAVVCAGAGHPECVGATCGNPIQCASTNTDCICLTLASGGTTCMPQSTSCQTFSPCGEGGTCASGSVCVVNSCCNEIPVCVPNSISDLCPPGTPACVGNGFPCNSSSDCCSFNCDGTCFPGE